jgi:hypothetical protein
LSSVLIMFVLLKHLPKTASSTCEELNKYLSNEWIGELRGKREERRKEERKEGRKKIRMPAIMNN